MRSAHTYLFSDCCRHVLVQYINDETKVYQSITQVNRFAYSNIFTVFEREDGTTNGKNHYKSMDGHYSMDYSDCGGWGIRKYSLRCTFMNKRLFF